MEILGVGPMEILFVLIIALIVLGPNEMVKTGKTIGKFLRKLVTSDGWRIFQQTSREIRHLPNRLMREAGLEELQKDIKETLPEDTLADLNNTFAQEKAEINRGLSAWTTPPPASAQFVKPPAETSSASETETEQTERTEQ